MVDIENVPLDTAQQWFDKGYYQCGETGDAQHTGYCLTTPQGTDCTPAAKQELGQVSFQGEPSPFPPHNTLPDVGAGSGSLIIAAVIAIVVGLITAKRQHA